MVDLRFFRYPAPIFSLVTLGYPNKEVKKGLTEILLPLYMDPYSDSFRCFENISNIFPFCQPLGCGSREADLRYRRGEPLGALLVSN